MHELAKLVETLQNASMHNTYSGTGNSQGVSYKLNDNQVVDSTGQIVDLRHLMSREYQNPHIATQ